MNHLPLIDAQAVHQAGHWQALVEHLRQAHLQPMADVSRVLMQRPDAHQAHTNALLVWPAWQSDSHMGVKVTTIFPGNTHRPTVQAVYLLMDAHNGTPLCLIDGTALTYWKTAADSALAAHLLAPAAPRSLLMVGAGALAPYLIQAHLAMHPTLQEVVVWNRSAARAADLVDQLAPTLSSAITWRLADDLAAAVANANLVCAATASTSPLLLGEWVQPGTHVDLVGGFTPEMRESDTPLIQKSRVFVDSRNFTVDVAGDLRTPIQAGEVAANHVLGDLFELCQGRVLGRCAPHDITLFKSGGGAHLDLMAAQFFYQAYCNKNTP